MMIKDFLVVFHATSWNIHTCQAFPMKICSLIRYRMQTILMMGDNYTVKNF